MVEDTIDLRYIAVIYNTILHTELRLQWYNFDQTLHSRTSPHISPSRASYGVSFARCLKKCDRDLSIAQRIPVPNRRQAVFLMLQYHVTLYHVTVIEKKLFGKSRKVITFWFRSNWRFRLLTMVECYVVESVPLGDKEVAQWIRYSSHHWPWHQGGRRANIFMSLVWQVDTTGDDDLYIEICTQQGGLEMNAKIKWHMSRTGNSC